jgi:hypothetical protein
LKRTVTVAAGGTAFDPGVGNTDTTLSVRWATSPALAAGFGELAPPSGPAIRTYANAPAAAATAAPATASVTRHRRGRWRERNERRTADQL